ncbi:MAG TPA: exo-alpha-sialidase [Firmicutes bacterium]|jgi:sialidase-1|nr:exo-alpha-sialidase [Bacillota bacterium]
MPYYQADILRHFIIADDPATYYAWPSIARLSEQELLVAAYSGDAHTHSHGKVVLYRSPDNGRTWSNGTVIADTILDDRDPGILVTRDGTIFVTSRVAWWKGHEGWSSSKHVASTAEADGLMQRFQHGYFIRSTDQGRTWSQPITYPFQPKGPIELHDGRLFAITERQGVACYLSDDAGDHWEQTGVITGLPKTLDVDGEPVEMLYGEPHCVQLPDGRIMALIRAHMRYGFKDRRPYIAPWNQTAFMWQAFSHDLGRNWTQPEQTDLWGFPPHLTLLDDDRLLVSYGRRWPPYGQRAAVWEPTISPTHFSEVVLRDDAPDYDLGYPSSAQCSDGTIVTVYYQKEEKGKKPCLMGTQWRLRR